MSNVSNTFAQIEFKVIFLNKLNTHLENLKLAYFIW